MRVVVDANPLFPLSAELGPTGVGRWTAGAVAHMARAAPDWKIELVAFHLTDATPDLSYMPPNVSFQMIRFSNRLHRKLMVLGLAPHLERFLGPADAMLGPAFVTWPARNIAEMPVIHDLTYLRYPRFVSHRNLVYLRAVMPRVVKRAAMVVTVSESMRVEIAERFRLPVERIAVVPNGYDAAAFTRSEPKEPSVPLPERYLLFVGTLEPRKNLAGLLDALDLLAPRRSDVPSLVVAGGTGWRNSAIADRIDRMMQGGRVQLLGYVDDAQLGSLYSGARALVSPSFYEGFGLPLLEAMGAGCPAIVSDLGTHREVGGDAAIYVDPNDASSIASGIERLLHDPSLGGRLAEAGRARSAGYTWARAGAALKDAIDKAVAAQRAR